MKEEIERLKAENQALRIENITLQNTLAAALGTTPERLEKVRQAFGA